MSGPTDAELARWRLLSDQFNRSWLADVHCESLAATERMSELPNATAKLLDAYEQAVRDRDDARNALELERAEHTAALREHLEQITETQVALDDAASRLAHAREFADEASKRFADGDAWVATVRPLVAAVESWAKYRHSPALLEAVRIYQSKQGKR